MHRVFVAILIVIGLVCLNYGSYALGFLILVFALFYLRYGTATDAVWEMFRYRNVSPHFFRDGLKAAEDTSLPLYPEANPEPPQGTRGPDTSKSAEGGSVPPHHRPI